MVHELWRAGAILGAAVTPVPIELFAEALWRSVERMTSRTSPPLPGETVRIYRTRPPWLPTALSMPVTAWRAAVFDDDY